MTGARGPGGMFEHLLSLVGDKLPATSPGFKACALDCRPGCLCIAHRPTEKDEISWNMRKKKETGESSRVTVVLL